jgi:hypothetical protein
MTIPEILIWEGTNGLLLIPETEARRLAAPSEHRRFFAFISGVLIRPGRSESQS